MSEMNVNIGKQSYNLSENFQTRIQAAAADDVITREEYRELEQGSSNSERAFLNQVKKFPSFSMDGFVNFQNFYKEDMVIPGNTNAEIVANISQTDNLDDTDSDGSRCGAACLVNDAILRGGRDGFVQLAHSLGLNNINSLTYENVHLVQEALFDNAGGVNSQGLGINTTNNQITGGTLPRAIELSGRQAVNIAPGNGKTNAVNEFFNNNPNGTVILNVRRTESGTNFSTNSPNHWVTLSKGDDGKFYLSDTFKAQNGSGEHHRALTNAEVQAIMSSRNMAIGIR